MARQRLGCWLEGCWDKKLSRPEGTVFQSGDLVYGIEFLTAMVASIRKHWCTLGCGRSKGLEFTLTK